MRYWLRTTALVGLSMAAASPLFPWYGDTRFDVDPWPGYRDFGGMVVIAFSGMAIILLGSGTSKPKLAGSLVMVVVSLGGGLYGWVVANGPGSRPVMSGFALMFFGHALVFFALGWALWEARKKSDPGKEDAEDGVNFGHRSRTRLN